MASHASDLAAFSNISGPSYPSANVCAAYDALGTLHPLAAMIVKIQYTLEQAKVVRNNYL
jgi:hypothetical protein